MAPGDLRKFTKKSYSKRPLQNLRDHTGKSASTNSVLLKSTIGLRDEEDMSFENEMEALLSTGTQNPNSKQNNTAPNKISDNMPQDNVVPPTHDPEIAAVASSDIQFTESHQDSLHNASATEASGSNKRSRGPTMGKGIMKMFAAYGKKMKINVDTSIERPINADESAKLASQFGVITRDVVRVPKRWKDIDEKNDLEPGFDHLKIHMDVDVDAPKKMLD